MGTIRKLLIANRGEIALRIQRAAEKLNIACVSIVSEADKDCYFARKSQKAVLIGPAPARDSYLDVDRIISVAREETCDALHPGYGFLSENADFAQRVAEAGTLFVGPDAETIRTLGSRTLARKAVTAKEVPCVPGSVGGLGDEELLKQAQIIGFPIIIKAVFGGGGRGMRVVNAKDEMQQILPRARAEVKKNFGSDDIFIEKYIEKPRHVEVQIFGDNFGNVVHFGTRDCSSQRRHQKLIEEAPAPFLEDDMRERIHSAAVRAAASVNYKNAGTAEFLVKDKEFYFLEMNTRIQVEHPVSEEITNTDLVELQLKVAMGEPLPFKQEQIKFSGHAIEYRIYAEDPLQNFAPSRGKIQKLERVQMEGLREDFGYEQGDEISLHYDALMSKIIVKGENRNQAIQRSIDALSNYKVVGLKTNVDLHLWLLHNGLFRQHCLDIGFIEREFDASCVKELAALKVVDSRHEKPIGGAIVKNLYNYKSSKFNTTYTIEVLHRNDGFFLAVPTALGRRAKKENCRISKGMDEALKSVINDVLESRSPAEVLAD